MTIAIIAAMPQEIRELAHTLENVREEHFHHLRVLRGDYQGHTLTVIESGIGKVNAAIATAHIIASDRPRAVIRSRCAAPGSCRRRWKRFRTSAFTLPPGRL